MAERGRDGRDGRPGDPGRAGDDGRDGLSAFELSVRHFGFRGDLTAWLKSLQGPRGPAGGEPGSDGRDGRELQLSAVAEAIRWRYAGDTDNEWRDLVPLARLVGARGDKGEQGRPGKDGRDGKNGADGRSPEMRVGDGEIQWRLEGDAAWIGLIALEELRGEKGKDGERGPRGFAGGGGGRGFPAGGAQGQVFTKLSDADGDADWRDGGSGGAVAAEDVTFTPSGNISATDVQAAIHELDTEKQPLDATLTALAGVTTAVDKLIYATGSDAFATADLTAAGRALLDDADASAQRTTLQLGTAAVLASDTDGTLTANSDFRFATQKAVKTYADQLLGAADVVLFKGVIDCSANPNYPAADAGWTYVVSVAGKIGGASGINVEVWDKLLCLVDGTASGNQATVGSKWAIAQGNLDGAVIGPASAVGDHVVIFNGTTGKLIKDSGLTLSGTNTGDQTSVSGNAGTATALATARNIDGVSFNGTADITVIAPGTHAASGKTTPVDADELPIVDSAASNVLKKLTFANLKAYLLAVLGFVVPVAHGATASTARPITAGIVQWIGSVEPTNAVDGDTWVNTA